MTKHVVVVGGGFAGIKAARELAGDRRFQVTLISAREDFEYHAALYRSATGRSPLEVAVPLKRIFEATEVDIVSDMVTALDVETRTVVCSSGTKYGYDELILALGAVPAYFGIKGLSDYSYNISTIEQALRLKAHLHSELTSGHKPDLNYVIVGAGPSGVELAAELATYLRTLRKNHRIHKEFHIDLVEAAPRILPALPERFSRVTEARLKQLGVKIYVSTAVKGETADALQLPNGNIDTHTVVWTAGLTNNPFFGHNGFTLGKGGKVEVDEHLAAAKHVWVAGDSALTARTGWAQTAAYDGAYVASVLKATLSGGKLPAYQPAAPIGAIPVGPNWCGVNMNGVQLFGYSGWLVRRWSDLELYRSVMPTRLALQTWLMGSRKNETCAACR